MTWLSANWWKIILLGILAVVGKSYVDYLKAQEDIQRRANLAAESRNAESAAQQEKSYIAKRRGECYEIYVKERAKWNNAQGPEYDRKNDVCVIRYKNNKPPVKCREPEAGASEFRQELYLDCVTNTFTNTF